MGQIQVLSFEVANLIAAGEVVDRPASAIKEMMENAIDAGAKHITVEIQNGGVTFMRVTDDGCGMSAEDLPMAVRRHATSKIRTAEDLDGILSLGFRGEALAAISSVSDMRIMSKRPEDEMGSMLEIKGGQLVGVSERGCRDGTTIIVENLFANVPARRKFLKRDATESMAVSANVERVALSHPEIAVRLITDGVTKLETAGDGQLKSAIWAVFGRDFSNRLLPLDGEHEGIRVTGYIGRSDNVRANRNGQIFFINDRFVKSRTAQAALEQAFTSYLPPEKYPVCVMNIGLNPARVDVNVHPAKLEVKFSNEKPVFEAVYYAVRQALEQNTSRPEFTTPQKKPLTPTGRVSDATAPIESERPASLGKRQVSMEIPTPQKSSVTPPPPSSSAGNGTADIRPHVSPVGSGRPDGPPPTNQTTQSSRRTPIWRRGRSVSPEAAAAVARLYPPMEGSITAEDYVKYYVTRRKRRRAPVEYVGTVKIMKPDEAWRLYREAHPEPKPEEVHQKIPTPTPAPDPSDMGIPTSESIPLEVYEAEAKALFGDCPPPEPPPYVVPGTGNLPQDPPMMGGELPVRESVPAGDPPTAEESFAETIPAETDTVRLPPAADSQATAQVPVQPPSPVSDTADTAYRLVGEVFHSYVIVEQGDRMLLIDKHAAHERIIFERLKASLKEQTVDSQLLMIPVEVMLMSEEVGLLDSYRAELEAVGFSYTCKRFTVSVDSIPSGIKIEAVPDMMGAIAEQLKSGVDTAKLTRDILFEKALYQASCKAAIKAGRDYPPEHIAWLVDELMKLPDITFCPHGRPVAMEMKKRNIDHQFERC